jgi:deazaflavin-dependent oxidoreductase (nitroreductase family)
MSESNNKREYITPDYGLLGEEHVEKYLATKGEIGHIWNGVPTLILSTKGRKTGLPRRQPMIYGRDGDDFVVVASVGGAPKHPAWYFNLCTNPEVEVHVKAEHFMGLTITAAGDERERLWNMMVDLWPNYEQYRERTDRVIPVVIIKKR